MRLPVDHAISLTEVSCSNIESPSSPTISCPSRCTMGIALDLDPNYFASYSEDGTVAVWDRRSFRSTSSSGEPALNFLRPTDDYGRVGGQVASLRYSRSKSGTFAVLYSNGGLRTYDTAKISDQEPSMSSSLGLYSAAAAETVPEPHRPRGSWKDSAVSLLDGARNGGSSGVKAPSSRSDGETLLVTRINDIAHAKLQGRVDRRIVSFDWMSDPYGVSRGEALRALCLKHDGLIDVLSLSGSSTSLAWGSRNGLSITQGRGLRIIPSPNTADRDGVRKPEDKGKSADHDEDLGSLSGSPGMRLGMHEKRRSERSNSIARAEDFLYEPGEVLGNDVCVVMRTRVELGYEMDVSSLFAPRW